jgi:hypothetical protein
MKVNYEVREDPTIAILRMTQVRTQETEGKITIVCKVGQIEYIKEFEDIDLAAKFIHDTFMFWKNPKLKSVF